MCSETEFTQENGNFHPTTNPQFHQTVTPDDLQDAGPHFDNHKKGMKNAPLRPLGRVKHNITP